MDDLMSTQAGSFLSGLSPDEREWLESSLEHRLFPQGSAILAEGDAPREMYIILSGSAEVSIVDPFAVEHRISTVGPGDSIGEMSILTGQPVSATVRATNDVEVLVLPRAEFANMVTELPKLYLNLGTILSTRLARTNRRAVQQRRGSVSVLINQGAPDLMGYALACSVAWHTHSPTLFVLCSDWEPDSQIRELIESRRATEGFGGSNAPLEDGSDGSNTGAVLLVSRPEGEFAPERIRGTLEDLRDRYGHVLIQTADPAGLAEIETRRINLIGPEERFTRPDSSAGSYALQGWSERSSRVGPGPDGILKIPAPSQTECDELRGGMLSLKGATGRTLGWAARDITGRKVGLALGAGSIKGYAHIGVLHMLERWNIPVDYIAGTSIGAAIAACYSLGFPPATVARMIDHVGKRAFKLAVPRHGMLSNSGVRDSIRRLARDRRIEDTRIPLALVAADINTGLEVVLKEGLIWPAVLASMAIPGIYPPIAMGDYMLVDGGVVNPVPSDAVSGMGADTVIAVKLARRESDLALEAVSIEPSSSPPLIIQTLTRSIEIMQGKIVTESAAAATITIEPAFPDVTGWGLRTFGHGEPFIEVGQAAAEKALPRLAAALPWLRE